METFVSRGVLSRVEGELHRGEKLCCRDGGVAGEGTGVLSSRLVVLCRRMA
jgi:hypothetical protein